jgi:hypothetical protein
LTSPRRLRAGDWVQVRSRDEIIATLTDARLDGLLVMPEMLELAGRRFRVGARAHKTCDTVNRTGGRRMRDAVHLDGVRCDGSAHDGCGAACLIFWKEAWLKRVDGPGSGVSASLPGTPVSVAGRESGGTAAPVIAAAHAPGSTTADPVYACQATCLLDATEPLAWWDLRQYLEDLTSGNVSVRRMLGGGAFVASFTMFRVARRLRRQEQFIRLYDRIQRTRGGVPFPRRVGRVVPGSRTPSENLDLERGESVRVKSFERILDTLDRGNNNRGLFFDAEEVPYCGQLHRVRARVDRIIDERTGRMIPIRGNTVLLEDTVCMGHYSARRMFCPREIYPLWRETWLERTDTNIVG